MIGGGAADIPALEAFVLWGTAGTILTGITAALWRLARAAAHTARRADQFMDDWYGEPERPGVPPRPGLMERVGAIESRLERVEHELHPDDGGSLRDAVDEANRMLAWLCPDRRPPAAG
ncbi:hypothetical protein ABZ543_07975 [Streptomyces roseifaciens]